MRKEAASGQQRWKSRKIKVKKKYKFFRSSLLLAVSDFIQDSVSLGN